MNHPELRAVCPLLVLIANCRPSSAGSTHPVPESVAVGARYTSFSCGGLLPWPSEYLSKVDVGVGLGPSGPNSIHRSTTAHGFKQSVVSPVTIWAVAVARTPWLVTPASRPMNVGSGFSRA